MIRKIPTEISHRSRGCVICPNGRMLFTDSNNQKLVILNNDGTLDKEITCSPYPPRDVTLIDDSTVAVSTSGDIRIINIDTKCTERVIKTTVRCSVNNILPLGQITHPLLLCDISVGILIFEYKVSLISLIECKVGGSTTDIICACLLFSVLRTALCGPVSIMMVH
jgi:hypothetical protein